MSKRGTLRLATRGSDLAMRQAATVQSALADRRFDVELVEVETRGDRIRDELIHRLGKTGAFVRSLDEKVLEGEVDGAIHSMKDVPTEGTDDLVVAAIPKRASPNDLLVTPDGLSLDELPEGATVGTSSLRRGAQLLRKRPDLSVEPLRGNVDTRIEKLLAPALQREHERRLDAERPGESDEFESEGDAEVEIDYERTPEEWFDDLSEIERRAMKREVETDYDAIVLAAAGLERTGLIHHVESDPLPTGEFVPAPGQGALAVTMRDSDLAESVHDVLDHPRSRVETTVERTVLGALGGGCVAPIGVHAVVQGEHVHTTVQALSRDGTDVVEATRDLPVERHRAAARDLAADLADRGADDLIEQARRDTDETEAAKREETGEAKREEPEAEREE